MKTAQNDDIERKGDLRRKIYQLCDRAIKNFDEPFEKGLLFLAVEEMDSDQVNQALGRNHPCSLAAYMQEMAIEKSIRKAPFEILVAETRKHYKASANLVNKVMKLCEVSNIDMEYGEKLLEKAVKVMSFDEKIAVIDIGESDLFVKKMWQVFTSSLWGKTSQYTREIFMQIKDQVLEQEQKFEWKAFFMGAWYKISSDKVSESECSIL